ncbi:hypothetical protein [Novosphingobium olei]|uniref:Uncharacterized protein n=1 Tax=Novosphingobium olei TaxID=2728851 RepID=A0A7Y0BKY6_9SPHN|nr:hypothetical protein [Novosphingobium olei]NML92125.1 hypothetical protein [Novosphingobium olei]BEV02009.1 hypothetical protein NSDW_31030 [Novosphingobium olei]
MGNPVLYAGSTQVCAGTKHHGFRLVNVLDAQRAPAQGLVMLITSLLAATIIVSSPAQPKQRAEARPSDEQALRCAASNEVLAAMLETSADASSADREDAALFRSRARNWLARTSQPSFAARFESATEALARQIVSSASPADAQALLEKRLGECFEPDTVSRS